jgi:hypothetical protein
MASGAGRSPVLHFPPRLHVNPNLLEIAAQNLFPGLCVEQKYSPGLFSMRLENKQCAPTILG